jgi:hypothetical protein
MGRGGLNTMATMDTFSLDGDTGACENATDESKALLDETDDWNDAYGVEEMSELIDDDWNGLLMGMEEANDILARPLEGPDDAASDSMPGFSRSASAPNLLGMPGAPGRISARPLTSQTPSQRPY